MKRIKFEDAFDILVGCPAVLWSYGDDITFLAHPLVMSPDELGGNFMILAAEDSDKDRWVAEFSKILNETVEVCGSSMWMVSTTNHRVQIVILQPSSSGIDSAPAV